MISVRTIDIDTNLVLRPIMPLDAEDIFNTIASERDYLGQWLPFVAQTSTINDTITYLNSIIKAEDDKNVYTIRYHDQFAGLLGFNASDSFNSKTEMGYWIREQFQHKGIMTRCVQTLCNFAFSKMDINRIQVKCAVGNTPSSAIPKRLGFQLEGIERDGELLSDGKYADLEVYSLLKRDI